MRIWKTLCLFLLIPFLVFAFLFLLLSSCCREGCRLMCFWRYLRDLLLLNLLFCCILFYCCFLNFVWIILCSSRLVSIRNCIKLYFFIVFILSCYYYRFIICYQFQVNLILLEIFYDLFSEQ
jgi:hypothetical protein